MEIVKTIQSEVHFDRKKQRTAKNCEIRRVWPTASVVVMHFTLCQTLDVQTVAHKPPWKTTNLRGVLVMESSRSVTKYKRYKIYAILLDYKKSCVWPYFSVICVISASLWHWPHIGDYIGGDASVCTLLALKRHTPAKLTRRMPVNIIS